jgi:hypothetical protein
MADFHCDSLAEFAGLPLALLEAVNAASIIQIGLDSGKFTGQLADWAKERGADHIVIDPAPGNEAVRYFAKSDSELYAGTSLQVLPALPGADAYIIDGDHNHYTVFHELRLIAAKRPSNGPFPLILLHDVGWPCGRRDFYHAPDQLPAGSRHRYSFHLGARVDSRLAITGGLRGDGDYAIALTEGGPGNGVLTAIEDFLSEFPHLYYAEVPGFFGLGVIADPLLATRLKPPLTGYAGNPLLERLERSRLDLYLQVLRLQDELNALSMTSQRAL